MKTLKKNEVVRAVEVVGSQQKLADLLGVTQQAVSTWLRRGWVPMRRAQEIEAHTGIPRMGLINPRIADLVDVDGVGA